MFSPKNSQETLENTKESPKPMAPRSPTEPFRLHGAPHPEIAAILQAHSSMAPFAQRKAFASVFPFSRLIIQCFFEAPTPRTFSLAILSLISP